MDEITGNRIGGKGMSRKSTPHQSWRGDTGNQEHQVATSRVRGVVEAKVTEYFKETVAHCDKCFSERTEK
jgi:hypothetical protein